MSGKEEDTVMHSDEELDYEDEDVSLRRMAERYRKMSENKRSQSDFGDKDDSGMQSIHSAMWEGEDSNVDSGFLDEREADDNEDQDQDISAHEGHNEDGDEDNNDYDNDNDSDDDDNDDEANSSYEDENPLLDAFRQLANARRNGATAESVLENVSRMLPGSLMFGGQRRDSRWDSYIKVMNEREDPYFVQESINELSERLLMMNGFDAERGLPHYQLSKALVGVMNEPRWQEHMELQLVACRCLYNLLEIEPTYCRGAIDCGVIGTLKAKLMEISSIDLAEQALQTLEFISRFHGYALLSAGCLGGVLMYLDFFTIHAQRKATRIVANSVKNVSQAHLSTVEEIFPTLQRIVIEFTDPQELENAWSAISLIVKNFRTSQSLEKIVTSELLNKILRVVSSPDTTLSTVLGLINTLSTCAQNNNLAVEIIKTDKVADAIVAILTRFQKGSRVESEGVTVETLMSIPKDLSLSILYLIVYLLPCDPKPALTPNEKHPKDYSSAMTQYKKFANQIFPLLVNIYSATVVFEIRLYALVCLIRIVASFEDLKDLKDSSLVINLLGSIVIQNKSAIRTEKLNMSPYHILYAALTLANGLMTKDPDHFITEFEREGLLADTSNLLEILRSEERHLVDVKAEMAQEDDERFESHDDSDEDGNDIEEPHHEEDQYDYEQDEFMSDEDELSDVYSQLRDPRSLEVQRNANVPTIREFNISSLIRILSKRAAAMEQTYLKRKVCGGTKLEHLRLLDDINGNLNDLRACNDYTREEWINTWTNFRDAIMKDSYTISSFELISSGIIETLSILFNESRFGGQYSLSRQTFLEVFKDEIFETLMHKLQESLTRAESFGIIGCGLKTGENRAASLGKQLKLKLSYVSDPDDDEPLFEEGMSSFVILVHAIASFNNINTFLKRKVTMPLFFGSPATTSIKGDWYLEFSIDDEVIPLETTIYGALYKSSLAKNSNFDTTKFWQEVHNVTFRKVKGPVPYLDLDEKYPTTSQEELELLNQPSTISILNLLKVLYRFHPNGDDSLFVNFKLTAKLKRQLEEPLIVASGILPDWSIHITRAFPFLFPLETRIFFLQSTSFGYSRLIQLWSNKASQDTDGDNQNNSSLSLGRITRHKVRVSRMHLLKSAFKVLDKLASHPSILEVEFNDEVGTGLGPTLEFYSNVCHCFAEKSLKLWRDNESSEDGYVYSQLGLFPAPISPNDPNFDDRMMNFKYLGMFIARALLDGRILDFSFNPVFFELCALEIEQKYDAFPLEKLKDIDLQLYKSLKYLKEKQGDDDFVAELGINFTVPGYDIELVEGGAERIVSSAGDVQEYIELVIDWTLNKGIQDQLESFILGFSEVFPYYSMLVFSPLEIVKLTGESSEDWSYQTLASCIHADHGYNIDSKSVQNLIKLMTSFTHDERRSFLKFLTGSPRLPIGGFKNLKPVFTVVLKRAEDGLKPDDYLPSVMTCANYLKLPDYSSLDMLTSKVKTAIYEGAGAFLLS
ncbi:UFD4 [Cyberlindnera jadinii]|uniref:HECT-type E3 ubiquitin transferase n=1 Tax=Cyberlindnera jadinii (strain ATCC 18201 / CBS 1600 / BCRC 20928 / JCM 3617 / NBRC 0987 / NRRL Y-1542) TaxID=983966 RepID=A0A0H5C9A9_CYBJN|nr:UFD4 [Cyberlindnera jadinii]